MTRRARSWLPLVPNWAWTVAFFLAPLALVVVFSFGRRGTYGGLEFGFDTGSYAKILDPIYLSVYLRSFAMAAVATLGCLVIGFPLAYFLAFKAGRWRNVLLLGIVIPFWTSLLVRTYAWMIILNDNGLLNGALDRLHLPEQSILYKPPAIALGLLYTYLPLMVLPLYVTLERIDVELVNAARDLGATGRRAFLRVTVPLALPGVVAGVLLVGIPATGEFLVPALLGGGKELMIGNLIGNAYIADQNWPFGSALSVVLVVILLALVTLLMRIPAARRAQESVL